MKLIVKNGVTFSLTSLVIPRFIVSVVSTTIIRVKCPKDEL